MLLSTTDNSLYLSEYRYLVNNLNPNLVIFTDLCWSIIIFLNSIAYLFLFIAVCLD